MPVLGFLPLLGQAAVLFAGGHMVVERLDVASAEFVAFNLYLAMLIWPLRMLGMWIGEGQRATASGERIFQVIDEQEDIRDEPDAIELPPGAGPRALRGRHVRLRPRAAGVRGARPRAASRAGPSR